MNGVKYQPQWNQRPTYGDGAARGGQYRIEEDRRYSIDTSTSWSSTHLSEDSESSQELDNVSVVVRVRPISDTETNRGERIVTQYIGTNSLMIDNFNGTTKSFTFSEVFPPTSTQITFFEGCGIRRLIDNALEGYSCTAFAYGATGSGKTHTITGPFTLFDGTEGDSEIYGLIQRSFQYLFSRVEQQPDKTFTLSVSYLEVYNEKVKDLLNPPGGESLRVRWSKSKGFYVENLFTVECETLEDVLVILEEGTRHRQMGHTNLNEHSSRSHCILMVDIHYEMLDPSDSGLCLNRNGRLILVDLAGSEKLKESSPIPDETSFTETMNINKSLLTLGNCISSLADSKKRAGYIPYRDSKLTQLLADSLGGNGITLMVACISPTSSCLSDSLNTLRYANRAKHIKNKPTVIMDPRERQIQNLKDDVKMLRSENVYMKQQLGLFTSTNPSPPDAAVIDVGSRPIPPLIQKPTSIASSAGSTGRNGAIDDNLYEMLQEYMIENERLRKRNAGNSYNKVKADRELQAVSRDNERLLRKLEELERVMMSSPVPGSNQQGSARITPYHNRLTPPDSQMPTRLTWRTQLKDQTSVRQQGELPPINTRRVGQLNGWHSMGSPASSSSRIKSSESMSSGESHALKSDVTIPGAMLLNYGDTDTKLKYSTSGPDVQQSELPTRGSNISGTSTTNNNNNNNNNTTNNASVESMSVLNAKLKEDIKSLDQEIRQYEHDTTRVLSKR